MSHPTKEEVLALLAERSEPLVVMDVAHYRYLGGGHCDTWQRKYDVRKLADLDDYNLSYVTHIVMSALKHGSGTVHTSVKYSFQDCESWYEACEAREIPPDATIINMDIES
jgi:hypothetical protein